MEVSKDERIERGGVSGRRVREREEVRRDETYSDPRNHVSVARRSERAAMAST